jgi:magnesium chelatase accessory protein
MKAADPPALEPERRPLLAVNRLGDRRRERSPGRPLDTLPVQPPVPDWPHAAACRRLQVGGVDWHFQHWSAAGRSPAPLVLLLHGTGAASASWRRLVPFLNPRFEVLAPDLPGHAHTRTPPDADLGLPGMVAMLEDWLATLRVQPAAVIGHSAGAAIGAAWCLNRELGPGGGGETVPGVPPLFGLNAALRPLPGIGRLFSPLARALAFNPLVPALFSLHAAQPAVLRRLLAGTGSHIDAEGQRLYAALVGDRRHAAGALRMMASWDLDALAAALPRLGRALHLVAGGDDAMLPAAESVAVHRQVPGSSLDLLPGLGHLAHEEDAAAVWRVIEPRLNAALGAAGRGTRRQRGADGVGMVAA